MTNPAVEAIVASFVTPVDRPYGWRDRQAQKALDALLASSEALRWLGSHIEPERLGYERCGWIGSTTWQTEQEEYGYCSTNGELDRDHDAPVYLAPRRGDQP